MKLHYNETPLTPLLWNSINSIVMKYPVENFVWK